MEQLRKLIFWGGLLILLAILIIPKGNQLSRLREQVNKAQADVEVVLQERSDSFGNLVEVVKGSAKHEEKIYASITDWRTALKESIDRHDIKAIENANQQLVTSVGSLLAIAQDYPELKANENFLLLQEQIESMENEIKYCRGKQIEAVNEYNKEVLQLHGMAVGKILGFEAMEYFKADESASVAPKVDFD